MINLDIMEQFIYISLAFSLYVNFGLYRAWKKEWELRKETQEGLKNLIAGIISQRGSGIVKYHNSLKEN